jgi:hypothetical protein
MLKVNAETSKNIEETEQKFWFCDSRHNIRMGVWQYTPSSAKRPKWRRAAKVSHGSKSS